MANTTTHNYSGNLTLTAADPSIFDSGNPLVVEPGAAAGEVIVCATPGNQIGVFQEKLQSGTGDNGQVNIRLLNAGGTVRVKAGEAISYGDDVSVEAGGTVVSGAAAKIGVYLGPDAADGDIIEIVTT